MAELGGAGSDLDRWLEPFLEVLGHKRRRTWAPLYLRGLLGPGERKSLQPMAARLGPPGHDQPQHFVASAAWNDAPARPGTTPRCGGCWRTRRTGWWAGPRRCW